MTIVCPKCQAPNETGTAAAGATLACSKCGNVLAVPAAAKKGMGAGAIIAIVLAVMAVPCLGILAAIAIPNFLRYKTLSLESEARAQVKSLCLAEKLYKEDKGRYLAAGPQPARIPGSKPAPFPADPAFQQLSFDPGMVRFQYQAVVSADGQSVQCVARGDLNDNGVSSEFTYDPVTGDLHVERQGE